MNHEIKRGRPKKGAEKPKGVKIVKRELAPEEIEEAKKNAAIKLEAGQKPNNLELGLYNRDRVKEFMGQYIAEHFAIPPIAAVEKALGVSYRTAEKYVYELLKDNQILKNYAKNANAKVMTRHLQMIMDDEKISPAYIREWYERFYDEDDGKAKANDSGKIVINIVTAKPQEIHVEDAKIVED